MNAEGLIQSAIKFVNANPLPPDPEYVPGSGAQTGDMLSMILIALLVAILAIAGGVYIYRKKFATVNGVVGKLKNATNTTAITKAIFIGIIAVIFAAWAIFAIVSGTTQAQASTKAYNGDITTPDTLVVNVSDEDGIVFNNTYGDHTSYIKNAGSASVPGYYFKVDTKNPEKVKGLTWNITIGDNEEISLEAGQSYMFKYSAPANKDIPIDISVEGLELEDAYKLCGLDNIVTFSYGLDTPSQMNSYMMEDLCKAVENTEQKAEDIKAILDEDFVNGALESCYKEWNDAENAGLGFYTIAAIMSPGIYPGGKISDTSAEMNKMKAIDEFDKTKTGGNNDMLLEEWNAYYEAIALCNFYNQIYDKTEMAGQYSNLGESKALRAICYYDLLRLFGNIPYFADGRLCDENAYQVNPVEVCDGIIQDFEYANNYIHTNKAKVTKLNKYKVCAILGETCLYKSYITGDKSLYANARKWFEDAINNSGYKLKINMQKFYNFGLYANSSITWDEKMPGGRIASNSLDDMLLNKYCLYGNEEINQEIMFAQDNKESSTWQNKLGIIDRDLQSTSNSPYATGKGYLTVNDNFYKKYCALGPLVGESADQSSNRPYAGNTLYVNGGTIDGMPITPLIANGKEPADYNDWAYDTTYRPIKFMPVSLAGSKNAAYYPYRSITKIADCYLMRAYCKMNQGDAAGAANDINEIKSRANEKPIPASYINNETMLKEYLAESLYEGNEFWFALMTIGLDQTDFILAQDCSRKFTNGDSVTYKVGNLKTTKGYLQIPQTIINKYPKAGIKQNAGW